MAAGEKLTLLLIEGQSGQERLKETSEVIMDTRLPNEDVYLYERKTKQSYCGRRKKKLYMNIFMST